MVAQINAARSAVGLPPFAYDRRLERVGDAHCAILIREGGQGHFSTSGVPPYLRFLLAGGHGFHRENAAMYSRSAPLPAGELRGVLERSVTSMLEERPPDDGHRRALLDPEVTHIGVGLAAVGGEVRTTHELATEVTSDWAPPPAAARPGSPVGLEGKLRPPWRPAAAKLLWEPLPERMSGAQASSIRAYGYPPGRAIFPANGTWGEEPAAGAGRLQGSIRPSLAGDAPFSVDRFGHFSFRWTTGARDGVELVVVLATDGTRRDLVPVAVSATVITATGALPPALAVWRGLADRADPPHEAPP